MNTYLSQTRQLVTRKWSLNLRTEHRAVEVKTTYLGIETEPFDIKNPALLDKVLRNYDSLPLKEKVVYEFTGVKEESLPLGLMRTRQTAVLPSREMAIRYLQHITDLPIA